jgi:DNA-binding NarL/FixJ family response regulator
MNCTATRSVNVLIMHSDPLLSAGLVAALRQHADLEIFVHGVDNLSSGEPRIDVVIADYIDALRLADRVARLTVGQLGEAGVLALTVKAGEADVRRAVESGVQGYVLVGGPLHELVEGVREVASGARYLCRAVAQRMVDSLTRATLTSREVSVLRLVRTGHPNKAIARQLGIELSTVKAHMTAILCKLGAVSRTHAASIAVGRGLVDEDASA